MIEDARAGETAGFKKIPLREAIGVSNVENKGGGIQFRVGPGDLQSIAVVSHRVRVTGRFARARDWLVRHITESIDEQRTLWSLRAVTSATLVHPADLSMTTASAARERLLAHARRYHGWWLCADLLGVAATAILVLLPGPNLIGYYFLFRVAGHFLSWQGARHALTRTAWRTRPEAAPVFERIVLYTRR